MCVFFCCGVSGRNIYTSDFIKCCMPHSTVRDSAFNAKGAIMRQYLCIVLENEAGIFLWEHRNFGNDVNLLSLDSLANTK